MITGAEIWATLVADPSFAVAIRDAKLAAVRREIVEQLPTVLKAHLANKATYAAVLKAKIAYAQWLLGSDYIRKQVRAQPADVLAKVDVKEVEESIRQLAAGALKTLKKKLLHTDEDNPSEVRGLNKEARALQKAGTLTIEDLLRVQPQMFVHEQGSKSKAEQSN